MKKLICLTPLLLLIVIAAHAQDKLPDVHLPVKGDLHFVSPEPIQYVDISDKNIEGDLPLPNVLRLRFKKDTCLNEAIVTIAGEKVHRPIPYLAGHLGGKSKDRDTACRYPSAGYFRSRPLPPPA
jgi:hypothetical protein